MKIKLKQKVLPKEHNTRTIKKFAWLPTIVEYGNERLMVWLRRYTVDQVYGEVQGLAHLGGWRWLNWVTFKQYIPKT